MVSTESIRALAEPVLASVGLELWDVEITHDVVRIMVERPARPAGAGGQEQSPAGAGGNPSGVDLDTLSAASGALSPLLDAHPEVVPERQYQLEVSSPGIERTLRTPDQYQRYLNTEITVKTVTPVEGARRHRGLLLDADANRIVLEPGDRPGTHFELPYDQIDRARTVLVWGPTAARSTVGRSTAARPTVARPTARRLTSGRTAAARQGAGGRATTAHNPKDAGS
jgi:ribosome maturation factor RimP